MAGRDRLVEAVIPPDELYAQTGIQKQIFNTIYRLMALKQEHPGQLARTESMLMIPDHFSFRIAGVRRQEYTNAAQHQSGECREQNLGHGADPAAVRTTS